MEREVGGGESGGVAWKSPRGGRDEDAMDFFGVSVDGPRAPRALEFSGATSRSSCWLLLGSPTTASASAADDLLTGWHQAKILWHTSTVSQYWSMIVIMNWI